MSLKVYYIKTPDVSLAIDHEDSHGEDSVFQPDKGESLTFRMEGGERLEYGRPEYQEMAQKLKFPDFKGMNLDRWREKFSPSPYLAKGEYTITTRMGHTIYIVGDHDCRMRKVDDRGIIDPKRGIDEIVDKYCDAIADSAATIYKDGFQVVHWEGNRNTFMDSVLKEVERKLADWAVEDKYRRSQEQEMEKWEAEQEKLQQPFRTKSLERAQGKIKLETFFQSGSAEISPQGLVKLDAFIEQNENAGEWLVEGYCDPIGSTEYNFDLGNRRAQAVAEHLREKLQLLDRGIRIVSHGETKAVGVTENQKAKDRRVTLLPDVNPLLRALVLFENKKEAPSKRHYLFDASPSMSAYKYDLKFYPYPRDSKIFAFNNCKGVHQLESMSHYSLCGGTPLWISVLQRIREMGQGEILTVVTDGMDTTGLEKGLTFGSGIPTVGLTIDEMLHILDTTEIDTTGLGKGLMLRPRSPDVAPTIDEIIHIAQGKKITINMINVDVHSGASYEETKYLIRVAKETGGMYYFVNPTR